MENHTAEVQNHNRLIIDDNEWQEETVHIISEVSQKGNGMVQLDGKNVTADGFSYSKTTKFKYYVGAHPDSPFTKICMFESLDDNSKGQMICINESGRLSCRQRVKEYSRIDLSETDIVFIQNKVSFGSSLMYLELAASNGQHPACIGFDKSGKALLPEKVDYSKPEAHFILAGCKV